MGRKKNIFDPDLHIDANLFDLNKDIEYDVDSVKGTFTVTKVGGFPKPPAMYLSHALSRPHNLRLLDPLFYPEKALSQRVRGKIEKSHGLIRRFLQMKLEKLKLIPAHSSQVVSDDRNTPNDTGNPRVKLPRPPDQEEENVNSSQVVSDELNTPNDTGNYQVLPLIHT